MEILRAINIKKYYGEEPNITKALNGVSMNVDKGEFVSIIGASGSGKSTLLHILGGLDNPSSGEVSVRGIRLTDLKEQELVTFRRRNIGFVFQDYNLVSNLCVYDNIVLPIQLDDSRVDDKYVKDICRMLHMEDQLDKSPKKLSGGQKQRVAIARALAIRPAIILADEPTGSLDSRNRWDVFGLLKRASKEYEQTIVMITHDQELAMNTDKMYRIEDGQIIRGGIV